MTVENKYKQLYNNLFQIFRNILLVMEFNDNFCFQLQHNLLILRMLFQ